MLTEPVHSVVNFGFYREVTRRSTARSFLYLAYLSLLLSVAFTAAIYVNFAPFLRETVDWAAASIPPLTFSPGKVTSPLTAPLRLAHPKAPQHAIVIDTSRTDPVTIQEMVETKAVGYLTQNTLYLLDPVNQGKMEQYDLTKNPSPKPVVVDAAFYRSLGAMVGVIFYPVCWLTAWVVFFLWKAAASLVYSGAGLALNAALSGGLDYPALFKIAAYAQTPVALLDAVLLFIPGRVPPLGLLLLAWLIVGVYTWQAIRQHQAPVG